MEADIDLAGKRLLLIKPSSLGDVVHAVPTAWALKQRWPTLHLAWLVNRGLDSLIRPLSCVDEVIPFDRNRFRGLIGPLAQGGELRSFTRTLREGRFDAVLDLQGLFRSGLFSWLSRAKVRVGDRDAREGAWMFYTRRVNTPEQPVHARARYAALAAEFQAGTPSRQDLDLRDTERTAARNLLAEAGFRGGPLVAVCPGARWETKVYPARSFAAVLDELAAQAGVEQPVLVGGPELEETCREIISACTRAKPLNLAGKTGLRELAALLDQAELMLTCDSGPMHIAAAQGTPTLAVFGPTDPRRTGPFGQLENVVTGECELMPCLKRHCPGMGLKCMRGLDPRKVTEKALALLRQTADNKGQEHNALHG
ncbi:MAG: lipopolysaccharide heptosyltransferase II [Planctomycetes bacterium]|nr:lipopolysaccharide heptosyltransferase II [Planctomycetota bacterium]MCB9935005.1 lipopolysaccharide heptosyltransferase II [Planctomycetota bacterium]